MAESIYLYYGPNPYLLQEKVEEQIKGLAVDQFNTFYYDLNDADHSDILEELQTISFFADQKIVCIKNFDVIAKLGEQVAKHWVKYFEKPNPDVTLFITMEHLFSNDDPIGYALFKSAYIEPIAGLTPAEFKTYVENHFKKNSFSIDAEAIETLATHIDYEFYLFLQEAQKLMLFKMVEKRIEKNDIIALVSRNLEDNIYALTKEMILNNQHKTIEIFHDLMKQNEDPLRVLSTIVSKVRELLHTRLLLDKGLRKPEIAQYFKYSEGRAHYLIQDAQSVSIHLLEEQLEKLAKLDYQIKSGQIDKKLGVELYLLGA